MSATRSIAAGTKYNFLGFLNSNNAAVGGTPTGASSGLSSGFALLAGLKTASPATGTPEAVQVTGDDELLGEFDFDSIEARTFIAQYAVQDMTVEANLLDVLVRDVGGAKFVAGDIQNAPQRTAMLVFNGRAKSQDAGTLGGGRWNCLFVLAASVKPLGRVAFEERSPAVYQLSISPQLAAYDAAGITIVDSVHGTNAMRYDRVSSDYPIHVQAFQSNGVATTFSLDYEPVSAARTVAYINRTAVTVNSVSVASKTATLNSAGTSGQYGVIIYQFNG